MPSSILLVARFIVSAAKRAFLPIGDDHQPVPIEALIAQEIDYGTRAFLSKDKIVVIRPPLIAVPFYHELILWISVQPLRGMEQSLTGSIRDGGTVIAKKDVLQPGKGCQSFSLLPLLSTQSFTIRPSMAALRHWGREDHGIIRNPFFPRIVA